MNFLGRKQKRIEIVPHQVFLEMTQLLFHQKQQAQAQTLLQKWNSSNVIFPLNNR